LSERTQLPSFVVVHGPDSTMKPGGGGGAAGGGGLLAPHSTLPKR